MTKKTNPDDLDAFQRYVKAIPKGKLVNMLCDAYWKNQLDKTEIRRAFLLSKKGVDIVNGNGTKKEARRPATSRRPAKPKVRAQRGGRS